MSILTWFWTTPEQHRSLYVAYRRLAVKANIYRVCIYTYVLYNLYNYMHMDIAFQMRLDFSSLLPSTRAQSVAPCMTRGLTLEL